MNSENANISSSEMTAYWRSMFPQFSKDILSKQLASQAGIAKAKEFEERFAYPLVGRKVSVRAGFICDTAKSFLKSGEYDACISIGSGFSLLNYLLAVEILPNFSHIRFFDLDLDNIIKERQRRLQNLSENMRINNIFKNTCVIAADLELACQEKKSLKDIFPGYNKPLFIIEGMIYFLSNNCVDWLIEQICSYEKYALIFDYWPQDGIEKSLCFKRAIELLKGYIPESVKSFWSIKDIENLSKRFLMSDDKALQSIEDEFCLKLNEQPKLLDQNEFFPVRFFVGQN